MKAQIVTLPGDYIGPEIIAQAVRVLEAVAKKYGHVFTFDERKLGGASIDAYGVPLTDETLAACNASDAVPTLKRTLDNLAKSDLQTVDYNRHQEQFPVLAWLTLLVLIATVLVSEARTRWFDKFNLFNR